MSTDETHSCLMTTTKTLDSIRDRGTIPLWPDAANVLGIGRDAAYLAARNGELPTLRMGRRILVPVPKLLALLGADAA